MSLTQSEKQRKPRISPRLRMGLGWIPAIDRYMEVVNEIDRANYLPQFSVFLFLKE
jgi:hypothetical protein